MTRPLETYTTQLQAGLGMIDETRILLGVWQPGMDRQSLLREALASGRFPSMAARRLRNLVIECFAPRYLIAHAGPARLLKKLMGELSSTEFEQLLYLYTCRATPILADFVRDVYWPFFAGGRESMDNEEARAFVRRANQDGRTASPWAPSTILRVGGYLTSCCADFGLLERGQLRRRKIVPFRIQPRTAAVLAFDLHFAGLGDNAVIGHSDWALFGLDRMDVLAVLRRLTLQGRLIVQVGGDATKISWGSESMEELADALAQG